MPAVSQAQQKFMGMCSSSEGRKKAKGKCPSILVAKEFARTSSKGLPEKVKKKSFRA